MRRPRDPISAFLVLVLAVIIILVLLTTVMDASCLTDNGKTFDDCKRETDQ